ncbi:hypothetical protein ACM66B_000607 [Microbotryomycetes sp. NB124-2]
MAATEDTQVFATFPSSSSAFLGPHNVAPASLDQQMSATADYDALKRNFEAANAAAAAAAAVNGHPVAPPNMMPVDAAQARFVATAPGMVLPPRPQPPQVTTGAAQPMPFVAAGPGAQPFGDIYMAAGAPGFGSNPAGPNPGQIRPQQHQQPPQQRQQQGAPPLGLFGTAMTAFVPGAQPGMPAVGPSSGHMSVNGTPQFAPSPQLYSQPTSPFLGVRTMPNPVKPGGSPNGQAQLSPVPGQQQQPGQFNVNGGMSIPGSPAAFAPASFGFAGGSPFPGGMMSPVLGMDAIAQLPPGFGMQYPMMGTPDFSMSHQATNRTVYVGNLPSDASVDELLSQVRFGPIEGIKVLPEKSCAFISFLDPTTAAAFHSDAIMRKIKLHDQELKIGLGKPSPVPQQVVQAVQQQGATRNVYLGNLEENVTEQSLRDDLSRFGPIDQVKIVRDKNIGFVHFLSIATAMKVVATLPSEEAWTGKRVSFGKDRTAYVPKNQHQQQQHNMTAAAMGSMAVANYNVGFTAVSPAMSNLGSEMGSPQLGSPRPDGNVLPGNRTVYLGNIHPETTTEEICNTIRGGILQQIRYIPDKHICFVTFVEPSCALAFFQLASFQGITLHNRRLKVGWGKNAGPTSPGIAMVVQSGGSRNVYVGNIEDMADFPEEKLRKDFGEYGDIELINSLKDKQCCFINFTNIANAIKAIEGIKAHPDYEGLKISYGKDRCGGPPRAFRNMDAKRQGRQGGGNSNVNNATPSPSTLAAGGAGGGSKSPFSEGMPFPDMGSPVPQAALNNSKFAGDQCGANANDDDVEGPGGLEMDEETAATAAENSGVAA